jgi:hypothetical protein
MLRSIDEDIRGTQVSMDDALIVQPCDNPSYLEANPQAYGQTPPAVLDKFPQR